MSDATTAAAIQVNGQDEPLTVSTLYALLETKDISPQMRGFAVARNGAVVARADWATTPVRSGDVIEIVLARQGG
jgi:sulfur carrier protein